MCGCFRFLHEAFYLTIPVSTAFFLNTTTTRQKLLYTYILQKKYFDLNTKDLSRKLDSELGGALEQLVLNVMQANEQEYDPKVHTDAKMMEDAEELYKAGQGKRGTNEAALFKILCAAPPEYLEKLNLKYADKYGYTLTKMLEKELGGDVQKAALFVVGMKLKPYEEVAKLIKMACAGIGTNELLLTSSLIRYQNIMKNVMLAHVELYGKTIRDRIKDETKGDYQRLLMEVLEAIEN
jgi:Annexin